MYRKRVTSFKNFGSVVEKWTEPHCPLFHNRYYYFYYYYCGGTSSPSVR